MEGIIAGIARDTAVFGPAFDVKMLFPTDTRLTGVLETFVGAVSGEIRGTVTVSDSENNASTCTFVEFELNPHR